MAIIYARLGIEDSYRAILRPRDPASILLLVNRTLTVIFSMAIAAIYVMRPQPTRARRDFIALAASFYASFLPLAMRPAATAVGFDQGTESELQLFISTLLIGLGVAFSIYAVAYLRLNFSVLPAARELVTGGPYRLIRHPVYLGEIVSAIGIALLIPSPLTAALIASFVFAQYVRTRMEEEVLTATIPAYADYARRTKRLIPGLL